MHSPQMPQAKKYRPFLTTQTGMSVRGTNDDHTTLIPEAVLPGQFFSQPRGSARISGHIALLRAVLNDAIECYQQQFLAKGRRSERLAKEAEDWLFSNEERWPFAFINVCAALGMEPDYVRSGLQRVRRNQSATVKRNSGSPPRSIASDDCHMSQKTHERNRS